MNRTQVKSKLATLFSNARVTLPRGLLDEIVDDLMKDEDQLARVERLDANSKHTIRYVNRRIGDFMKQNRRMAGSGRKLKMDAANLIGI